MKDPNLRRGLTGNRVMVDADKGVWFQPMFDRILVAPKETKSKTEGGIIIPDTAKIEETMGIVVAVGHGHFDEHGNYVDSPCPFKIGDTVVYKEFTGLTITLGEKEKKTYRILWTRDVLGVLMKDGDVHASSADR